MVAAMPNVPVLHPETETADIARPAWWGALLLLVLPLLLLALSGCVSAAERQARECPRAGMMQYADRLSVFDDMQAPTPETVTVNARLAGYNYGCRAVPKKGALEVHLTLSFAAQRTALAGGLKGITLPYFVAVIDAKGNIVERQRHKVRLAFSDQDSSSADRIARSPDAAAKDQDHVILVRGMDAADAQNHRITFGFELVPAQLRHNRGEAASSSPSSNAR
jgi:hypothetical protein